MKLISRAPFIFFTTLLLFIVFTIANPQSHTYAQENNLIVPIPGATADDGPAGYIKNLYTYAVGLGALLAMVMIVVGAVQYTLSEAITSKEDAKDRIMKAVWGLILLLTAVLILNTINPELTTLNNPSVSKSPIIENQDTTQEIPPTPSVCGNGVLETGEKCEVGLENLCGGSGTHQCVQCKCFFIK